MRLTCKSIAAHEHPIKVLHVHAGVLVAGGGPAGYATAIALANAGVRDIHVVERHPSAGYYEPTKAFAMALVAHGKDTLRDALGVAHIDHAGAF